jgi:D-alanyl-lipoteichoic acid acyltransferase DltB (MBOAT superfamily)
MLFNSVPYLIFFPVVIALYFSISKPWRWLLLLGASYFFYMCWKAEYVLLLMATTLVVYGTGILMGRKPDKRGRRKYLILSLVINLGILALFKYVNFFSDSVDLLFSQFNLSWRIPELKLLLPVGISFYTFQALGYSIDVYRGTAPPETHLGKFALFVSFFPQLLMGPIERSRNMLPQYQEPKSFSPQLLVSGVKLMAWGFFKKLVIADRLGIYVSSVYDNPSHQAGLPVIVATVFFAFQLYCDFSAYTDIARGSARVLGYDLMINFNRPFIARSIADFWRRWHISLTTWFRDYLFFSLSNNRKNKFVQWKLYLNLLITFLLIGLWHGAKWTFVFFGFLQGCYLIFEAITQERRERFSRFLKFDKIPRLVHLGSILLTFSLLCFSIVFFRADSLAAGFALIGNAFHLSGMTIALKDILANNEVTFALSQIVLLLVVEQIHAKHNLTTWLAQRPAFIRWPVYISFVFYVLIFGILTTKEFLYFQF